MDAQLPVDTRTLDAGEDAQVGGEPRWVWRSGRRRRKSLHVCVARRRVAISHRLHTDASISRPPTSSSPLLSCFLYIYAFHSGVRLITDFTVWKSPLIIKIIVMIIIILIVMT